MPISEIGLLKLKPDQSFEDSDLQAKLTNTKAGLEKFTGYPFYFFQQIEDPAYIYLLGEWKSLKSHYEDMHNSNDWKENVMVMSKFFDFQWMAHYNFVLDKFDLESQFLEVGRFTVAKDKREIFEKELSSLFSAITGAIGDIKTLSGWKVDEKRDAEEFVLLIPWKDQQQQVDFVAGDGGKAFDKLQTFADKTEVHHIRKRL